MDGTDKMIIVDFHQIMISNIIVHLTSKTINKNELDENLVRHMILNSIRMINNKFKDQFGNLVIAYDSSSWRKQVFPYYKANRKKAQDKSPVDWVKLFEYFGRIKPELKQVLPYKVIEVEGCEADDIIGVLTRYARDKEPVMIVSGDKDFIQLQADKSEFIRHMGEYQVHQYDPVQKKYIKNGSPVSFLFEHILRGDPGDGIPNILSDDDTFVSDKRQRPLTKKKMKELSGLNYDEHWSHEPYCVLRNFRRNQQLIDLTKTPENLTIKVMEEYAGQPRQDRGNLYQYLVRNRCKQLLESINDF